MAVDDSTLMVEFSGEHVDGCLTKHLKEGDRITIGRSKRRCNCIVVPRRELSARHVEVVHVPGVRLCILNMSKRGTFYQVNGEPEQCLVKKGMTLHLTSSCVCDLVMPGKPNGQKQWLRICMYFPSFVTSEFLPALPRSPSSSSSSSSPSSSFSLAARSIVESCSRQSKSRHSVNRRCNGDVLDSSGVPLPRSSTQAMHGKLAVEVPEQVVPVLLVGARPTPLNPTTGVDRPTVFVMGMHHSGTKALIGYVRRHFECHVEPVARKRGKKGYADGAIEQRCGGTVWKHAVPSQAVSVGPAVSRGPLVLLFCVREVASWMRALSLQPYEIKRCQGGKRKRAETWWMLERIMIDKTVQGKAESEQPRRMFESIPALWATYAAGYLGGRISGRTDSSSPALRAVVRWEDIVARPIRLMEELTKLGLPRSAQPLEVIDESFSRGQPRSELLGQTASRLEDECDQRAVRAQLAGCIELCTRLGYSAP